MTRTLLLLACALILSACGGGGGSSSGSATLYVRESGDDAGTGLSPADALRTVARAAALAGVGDTIIVGPGDYEGMVDILKLKGTPQQPVVFLADETGASTNDRADEVVIDAGQDAAAVRISNSTHIVIDGFKIIGARATNGAGVQVRSNSANISIRNCVISGNRDGIRVEESDDVLIFNNLIVDNTTRGVRLGGAVSGSQRAKVINNTIADNLDVGIAIGREDVASAGAFLRNNIVQDNQRSGRNIDVEPGPPSSLDGYDADYNLVFSAKAPDQSKTYRPTTIVGPNDVNEEALFIDPSNDNYRLDQADSPAIDAGDPDTDPALASALAERTTAPDGKRDAGVLDLGYHYPR